MLAAHMLYHVPDRQAAGFYQDQIARPWPEVAQDVRQDVQAVIDHEGAFVVSGDLAAFVCR